MAMRWERLVSELRCPMREGEAARAAGVVAFRSAFEGDYDRIVFSTPFRRLARKTQVHPMALNDHVHTRLTHSLEVASVGRSLGHRLAGFLGARGELGGRVLEGDLIWIIQAACLAHDIGNPPFGHAGEYAIRKWATMHRGEVFGEALGEGRGVMEDLAVFDGNAQGFRMAARGDNPQSGYLRLTFASLGTMVKYPWDSGDGRAKERGKFNVFSTEKWVWDLMVEEMGMRRESGEACRHPLSFLAEAADDICYRILDLEDAVEMGILGEAEVRGVYRRLISAEMHEGESVGQLRGRAIEGLINGVWKVFEGDYERIMRGERGVDLKSDLEKGLSEAVEEISLMYDRIFADRTKVAAELGAYQTLGRIVGALCRGTRELSEVGSYEGTDFLVKRCLDLAWGKAYASEHAGRSYLWWLHQVIDFVSGLTDNYARQFSREIEGV